jgi:LacI family transcriptional regulator
MYTIRDVARLADVSVTTASAVINGKRTVKEALRQRVMRAMEELAYQPDSVARSLKVRRTMTVGIVVPDVTNPFYPAIMRPMEDVARRSGYSVIFCDSNEDQEQEQSQLSTLFSRRVDGVAIAPANPYAVRDRVMRQHIPFVLFDRVPANFPGAAVVTDNFEASRNAVRYLIGLGHQRLAVIVQGSHLAAVVERLEGFQQALQEKQLPIREEYIRRGEVGETALQSAWQCGVELMRLPEPPTAILCGNNRMTLGIMRALGELRIPCPDRVSVLGFDDFDWAASSTPTITTIEQPTYEMGNKAMQLLVQKIEGEKDDPEQEAPQAVVLPSKLHIRNSTAPPPEAPKARTCPVVTPEASF